MAKSAAGAERPHRGGDVDDVVPPSDASASPPSDPSPARDAARPRLRVLIPPVPPFLHEVDKRIEREARARRGKLQAAAAHSADENTATARSHNGDDADDADDGADFRTPEKQQTQKRKAPGGDLDEHDQALAFQESDFRMSQVTPPPSARMLDHKNPPQPPRKAKKRRRVLERPINPVTGRMRFSALPLPRLSLPRLSLSPGSSISSGFSQFSQSSPPRLDTPPGSPVRMASVFRSLADEFAAVQDTPPVRGLRMPPRIARAASRRCTPPISSRTRSAIQTPTMTMVLRSRQLNPR